MIAKHIAGRIVEHVDIVAVIGADVTLERVGKYHIGLCPFHAERTPSFTVSQYKKFFHCLGCGAWGSVIGYRMKKRGLEYDAAVIELAAEHEVDTTP